MINITIKQKMKVILAVSEIDNTIYTKKEIINAYLTLHLHSTDKDAVKECLDRANEFLAKIYTKEIH